MDYEDSIVGENRIGLLSLLVEVDQSLAPRYHKDSQQHKLVEFSCCLKPGIRRRLSLRVLLSDSSEVLAGEYSDDNTCDDVHVAKPTCEILKSLLFALICLLEFFTCIVCHLEISTGDQPVNQGA